MAKHLYPCLWFDGNIAAATHFYCSLFENSNVLAENSIVTKFEIEGTTIKLLNGGTLFTKNPSISFYVKCTTKEEVEKLWHALSAGGKTLMPLGNYPWCPLYGWVEDKYGMSWQLFLTELKQGEQRIVPSLLFTKEAFGSAAAAMQFYTDVFKEGQINYQAMYLEGEGQPIGSLKFGSFKLNQSSFVAMDGPGEHAFTFNEGIAFVVECKDQDEVDYYWDKLSAGGFEGQCGWLKDKFGISWQILPIELNTLMGKPATAEKARNAFMKMRKIIIQDLY
jgi:predicted 3-demethylubiquinone-9 3-methyltransferase (glyoxalase superfamily)